MDIIDLLGASREIGARFTLIGFLPAVFLALFVLALIWSGAPSERPDPDEILAHARALDAWAVGLLFLTLVVAAVIVQPLQLPLVRLFEGYWGGSRAALAFAGWKRNRHERRLAKIEPRRRAREVSPEAIAAMADAEGQRRRLFPVNAADVQPTALGNVMRASETWAGYPYNLELTVVWPRLFPLLPDPLRLLLDDRRDQLDVTVRFAAVFAIAATVSFGLLLEHGAWLAVPAACVLLAWTSYRSAISAAFAYGEAIRSAVDLHRFDLLSALHLPLPQTLSDELDLNEQVSVFLLAGTDTKGTAAEFKYNHGT